MQLNRVTLSCIDGVSCWSLISPWSPIVNVYTTITWLLDEKHRWKMHVLSPSGFVETTAVKSELTTPQKFKLSRWNLAKLAELDCFFFVFVCLCGVGEQLLQAGEVFSLSPLQLYSVSQQLRLAKPTCCNGDAKTDLGHILDFTCRLRYLKVTQPSNLTQIHIVHFLFFTDLSCSSRGGRFPHWFCLCWSDLWYQRSSRNQQHPGEQSPLRPVCFQIIAADRGNRLSLCPQQTSCLMSANEHQFVPHFINLFQAIVPV